MSAAAHRLEGLEPDNLLAFMALLGLLRALERARPNWRPRAYWDAGRRPLRPVLTIAEPATPDEIAAAAAEGVAALAVAHAFDRQGLVFKPKDADDDPDAKILADAETAPDRAALFGALVSDGAVNENKDGELWPTPLCFQFGQGHQHFLERLAAVPNGTLPSKLAKTKKPPNLRDSAYIAGTLFAPWTRSDPTDGFRWDPAEDRRYALRHRDPSGDPAGQQHGANMLAAVGLSVLSGTAIVRRGQTRFLIRGAVYENDGRIAFRWPLWTLPVRLGSLATLLAHPALAMIDRRAQDTDALARLGVVQVMQARRILVGKFFNVEAAKASVVVQAEAGA